MKSNLKRNTNTAIMFALCLSFLLFSGCSFILFSRLIETGVETTFGADLFGYVYDETALITFLDEIPISEYLKDQQDQDGAVLEWSFSSPDMKSLLRKINPEVFENTAISDFSGYKTVETNVYSIQSNFLRTVMPEYYMPTQIDQNKISDLKKEGIIVESIPENGNEDIASLISLDDPNEEAYQDGDPFDVTVSTSLYEAAYTSLDNINVIVPEGFRDFLSFDTDKSARLCVGSNIESDC